MNKYNFMDTQHYTYKLTSYKEGSCPTIVLSELYKKDRNLTKHNQTCLKNKKRRKKQK